MIPKRALIAIILVLASGVGQAADVQTNIGSYETLQTLDGTVAINCGTAVRHRTVPVVGNATPVTMTANPQIAAGSAAGQLCDIKGTDDLNTVTLPHGNGLTLIRGTGTSVVLTSTVTLPVRWTGSAWEQRLPVRDTAEGFRIDAPTDVNVVITTAGSGQATYNGAEIATLPEITLPLAFQNTPETTANERTIPGVNSLDQFCLDDQDLKYCNFEQGGNWYTEIRLRSDNSLVTRVDTVRTFEEQPSAPATPDLGRWALYFKSGGLYHKDDAGAEVGPLGSGVGTGDVVGDDTSTTAQNIVAYTGTGGKNITELTGTQGDVLYHNGTSWVKLAAGTSGHFLKTNGAGQNPAWAAASGAVTSRYFDAISLVPDGTNCVAGVLTLNSGPVTDVITCADTASSSIIYGKTPVSAFGGCPSSTLNMSIHVYHATAEAVTYDADFSAMYRRISTDAVNSTWGSAAQALINVTWVAHEVETGTASVTPNGTCDATSFLFWRLVIDGANYSTSAASSRLLGVTLAHP